MNPRSLWKFKKGVFGWSEAPQLLWLPIRKDLLACGWTEVKAAPATFILKNRFGKLCGVLVLHVDDVLLCGSGPTYDESLRQLQKREPLKI